MSHKTQLELEFALESAKQSIQIGGIYAHYKTEDHRYKVLKLAIQESSNKVCVVYQALYNPRLIFVRDLDNWLETVEIEGKIIPRFKLVGS